jgi:hypothetical protein
VTDQGEHDGMRTEVLPVNRCSYLVLSMGVLRWLVGARRACPTGAERSIPSARSARPIQVRGALGVVRPLVGEVVQQEVLRCGHARCPGFGGRGRPQAAARRAPLEESRGSCNEPE